MKVEELLSFNAVLDTCVCISRKYRTELFLTLLFTKLLNLTAGIFCHTRWWLKCISQKKVNIYISFLAAKSVC